MKRTLLGLSVLLAVSPAYAVTMQSTTGGSGLGTMRTAEIMDSGEVSFSVNGQLADYLAVGTLPETLNAIAVPALSYGMGGWGEISLTVPYLEASPSGSAKISGAMDPQLVLKIGPGRPVDGGFAPALTLFGSVGSTGNKSVVSGDANYGIELNMSNWYDTGALHFNIGYEETDTPLRNTIPLRVKKYTAAFGAEKALSDSTSIFIESTAYQEVDSSNNNMIITAGFQFVASDDLGFQVGYGQGFPSSRSEPDSLVFFGMTYSPNGQPKRRYSPLGSMEEFDTLERQNKELASRVDTLNSKVDGLDNRVTSLEAAPVPAPPTAESAPLSTGPRVEVINASSNPAIVTRVLEQLKQAGAHVVNVRKAGSAPEKKTWIGYREGFSDQAVALGHQIDGDQVVIKHRLDEGVDILVVIGNRL